MEEHAGQGLTFVLEITSIVDALHLKNALDVDALDVRIVPVQTVPEEAQVSIGRVSIFRQGRLTGGPPMTPAARERSQVRAPLLLVSAAAWMAAAGVRAGRHGPRLPSARPRGGGAAVGAAALRCRRRARSRRWRWAGR